MEELSPRERHCPACGTALPPESRFCGACGAEWKPVEQTAAATPVAETPAETPAEPTTTTPAAVPSAATLAEDAPAPVSANADGRVCPWCEAVNERDATTCAACGAVFPKPEADAALEKAARDRIEAMESDIQSRRGGWWRLRAR